MHNREVEFFPASFHVSWLSLGVPDGGFSHFSVPGLIYMYFFITHSAPIKQKYFLFNYQFYFTYWRWVAKVSSINKSVLFLLANIAPYLGKCFNLSKSETDANISGTGTPWGLFWADRSLLPSKTPTAKLWTMLVLSENNF